MDSAQISIPQSIYDKLRVRAKLTGKKNPDELASELLVRALQDKHGPANRLIA